MKANAAILSFAIGLLLAATHANAAWTYVGDDSKGSLVHDNPEQARKMTVSVSRSGKSLTITHISVAPFEPLASLSFAEPVADGYVITAIGETAFRTDKTLTKLKLTFGNGLTRIDRWAFAFCAGLTELELPDSVTDIGQQAFFKCSGLTELTIPAGVTNIEWLAFARCSGLTSVTIPDHATSIGDGVFAGCTALTNISVSAAHPTCKSIDGVLFDKTATTLNTYPAGRTGAYAIPSSVTRIGMSAFNTCGLTDVTIPDSVTHISSAAFAESPRLTNISVSATHPTFKSVDGVLFDKAGEMLHAYPAGKTGAYTIPATVTRIDDAFVGCFNLTRLTIPATVTEIISLAFNNCSGLEELTIPDNVTSIGSGAFKDCSGLTKLTVGSGVTNIAMAAFFGCRALASVTYLGPCTATPAPAFLHDRSPAVTSYVQRAHAASWTSQLDSGSLADGTAVWGGRPIRFAVEP